MKPGEIQGNWFSLAGLLVRIEASGKRMTGRFVNRKFRPVKSAHR
jgi:hypothetical protein